MSVAIDDLSRVPNIIGSLGLAIAEAQKAFDVNYLNGLERLAALALAIQPLAQTSVVAAKASLDQAMTALTAAPGDAAAKQKVDDATKALTDAQSKLNTDPFLFELIKLAAPARYQFTTTTLSVKLDLSESTSFAGSLGLGFGFAGVVVNASASIGFAQDYRAGAEITTTLNAVLPPNDPGAVFNTLLSKTTSAITLSPIPATDQRVLDGATNVAKMIGIPATPVKAGG